MRIRFLISRASSPANSPFISLNIFPPHLPNVCTEHYFLFYHQREGSGNQYAPPALKQKEDNGFVILSARPVPVPGCNRPGPCQSGGYGCSASPPGSCW